MPDQPSQPKDAAPDGPEAIVRALLGAISRRDVEGILALLTEDHEFIDAAGRSIRGADLLRSAWRGYFAWFPNYEVVAEEVIVSGPTVAVFGYAGGTYAGGVGTVGENTWRLPAAWRAVVRDGKVAVWQVYCDTEPVWAIMKRGQRRVD